MTNSTKPLAARSRAQRVIAADAVWDTLLGIALIITAFPTGASALGIPTVSTLGSVVLAVVGVGSLAYAVVLARACRHADAAEGICAPTAIANGAGSIALVAVLIGFRAELDAVAPVVITVAAVGCAAFAGAEWIARPRPDPD